MPGLSAHVDKAVEALSRGDAHAAREALGMNGSRLSTVFMTTDDRPDAVWAFTEALLNRVPNDDLKVIDTKISFIQDLAGLSPEEFRAPLYDEALNLVEMIGRRGGNLQLAASCAWWIALSASDPACGNVHIRATNLWSKIERQMHHGNPPGLLEAAQGCLDVVKFDCPLTREAAKIRQELGGAADTLEATRR